MAFHAVQSKFFGRRTEIVVLLILDSKGYLKYMDVVNEGSVRGVPLYIRERRYDLSRAQPSERQLHALRARHQVD